MMKVVLTLQADPPPAPLVSRVVFSNMDYLFFHLCSQEEVLASANVFKPALYLFDEYIPGSTGQMLAKQLSFQRKGARIPIILLGNWKKPHLEKLKGVTYLQQPCSPEEILQTIHTLCHPHVCRQERQISHVVHSIERNVGPSDDLIGQQQAWCARRLRWLDQRRTWLSQRQTWLSQRKAWIETLAQEPDPQREWVTEQREWLKQQQQEVEQQSQQERDLRRWLHRVQRQLDADQSYPSDNQYSS